MKLKLTSVFFLVSVLLVLMPFFNVALALVVNPPVAVDMVNENNDGNGVSFEVLTFEVPVSEGKLNSKFNTFFNKLTMDEKEASMGIQGFSLTSTFLHVKGITDGFAPIPLPTSMLLLGAGLVGLIGIARRNLFTR